MAAILRRLMGLPASVRQALPALERGLREGLSSRTLTDIIRRSGIPISRTSVLRGLRALRGESLTITDIKLQPRSAPFDPERLPESITNIRKRFSFKVAVRGFDADGRPLLRGVTVATDDGSLSPDEIIERAEQALDDPDKYGFGSIESIEIVGAKRRAGG